MKQQLLQAQATIQHLQMENEKLKREISEKSTSTSSSSGIYIARSSSDTTGLAVVGRNAAHSSPLQPYTTNTSNTTTQRNQQQRLGISSHNSISSRPKLQPVQEERSAIRPMRRTTSKTPTSSISTSTNRKPSLRPTAGSSSSVNNGNTSSSTSSHMISEDELLARRLQQEELNVSPFQTYIDNFDHVISNNYFNYQDDNFGQGSQSVSSTLPSHITGDESYEELLRLDENIVKIGVNKDLLWRFPTFIHDGVKSANEENNSCICCMEEYNKGDQLRRLTCFHTFHKDCIDQWLESSHTCPICKLDLNEN